MTFKQCVAVAISGVLPFTSLEPLFAQKAVEVVQARLGNPVGEVVTVKSLVTIPGTGIVLPANFATSGYKLDMTPQKVILQLNTNPAIRAAIQPQQKSDVDTKFAALENVYTGASLKKGSVMETIDVAGIPSSINSGSVYVGFKGGSLRTKTSVPSTLGTVEKAQESANDSGAGIKNILIRLWNVLMGWAGLAIRAAE
ncbi:MAG: hypothetical protein HY400_02695, partial [Elusimicrobia bacterium]|nr:hypothetical protein [Elusimicrobiota bacterium]